MDERRDGLILLDIPLGADEHFDESFLERTGHPVAVTDNIDRWQAIAEGLDVDKVTVLTADEDIRAAEREQWDDGTCRTFAPVRLG